MKNEGLLKIVTDGLETDAFTALLKLKEELIENIRVETLNSKSVKSSDISIIKKITKLEKERPIYGKAHVFRFGDRDYFGFTQGYYILAGNNDFGCDVAIEDEKLKLEQFFNYELFSMSDIKIDITELKVHCKTTNKKEKKPYIIEVGDIKIGVNPFYLLDVLQFNETDIIIVNPQNQLAPLVAKNDIKGTLGMLLPIRL